MIPMFYQPLAAMHFWTAVFLGITFALVGSILVLLHSDDVRFSYFSKQEAQEGFIFIAFGAVVLVFGLYALVPLIVLCIAVAVYKIALTLIYLAEDFWGGRNE